MEEEGRAEGSISPSTRGYLPVHRYLTADRLEIFVSSEGLILPESEVVRGNRLGDTGTDEYWTLTTFELLHHRCHTVSESDHDHVSRFHDMYKVATLVGMMKDVRRTISGKWRNDLDKLLFMHAKSVSSALAFFKSASGLLVGMILFGNTPAVGAVRAMAPEAAEPGSLQTGDFEKWSNFWFGMVNCIGVLAAIITLIKSFNCKKRHLIAGTSAASAPAGAIMDRAVNKAQRFTVLRAWHETEYCELLVARCEEEGAYAP